ncbi:synaptic vesicle 2-related protein isoform X2 [Anastrepha obliqua]|uniref:synaptic vesicle 2-related protein isoform X1 n=2 Tax=Anastrepha obliqua TaxID=95512 RepID=UPI002409CD31|nr:synaptic vesicle 2-related protein isoform X1 [Anastrepha obliqua]XP_054739897.1 synaptic vesicle 2-related protein isoform X2 [Anastrepha obliqua]
MHCKMINGDPSVKHSYEDILELKVARHNHNELLNIDGELDIQSSDTYTVQQAVNLLGFGWFHVKLSLFVGLCWMADSMEMTILSIIGPAMQCEWNISTYQKALMTTVVFLGMMISPSFWSQLSDRYGRKSALTFCGVLLVLYSLLSSVAPNFTWLLILRGLVGFSIGCIPQSVTLYAEFLPSKHKGKCVVLMDCFWALGACFEIALALAIYPNFGWRWLLGLSAAPLLLFTSLTPWLTESARFHTLNGNNEKAVRVLEQIAKDNNRQMLIGRLTVDRETNSPAHMRTLLKPELRKITLLLWFIWMSCAFCYYGLVLISAELFLRDKADSISNQDCNTFNTQDFMDLMWITFSEFPGIFSTTAVIKRYGKKKTMALQFLIFSGCVSLLSLHKSRIYTISILFIARGVISGLFQAAYIYTPEIYPNNLRSVGVGGCSTIARIGAMATPFISQVLFQTSASSALIIYSLVGLLSAVGCIILPDNQVLA